MKPLLFFNIHIKFVVDHIDTIVYCLIWSLVFIIIPNKTKNAKESTENKNVNLPWSIHSQVMIKSGSRASLLTNGADETDSTKSGCTPTELKRYKSLPGDKLLNRRRRVKRRAPSPPKDRPRYCPPPPPPPPPPSDAMERKKQQQTLDLPKEKDSLVSTGSNVGGVRLRRKKFQIFNRNKPM